MQLAALVCCCHCSCSTSTPPPPHPHITLCVTSSCVMGFSPATLSQERVFRSEGVCAAVISGCPSIRGTLISAVNRCLALFLSELLLLVVFWVFFPFLFPRLWLSAPLLQVTLFVMGFVMLLISCHQGSLDKKGTALPITLPF